MKALIFPKSTNPYIELLYSEMRNDHQDDTFSYFEATPLHMLFFPLFIAQRRLQGYRVFHLHWPLFYIGTGRNIPFAKVLSFAYSIICLTSIKLLGFKLVWTVHNVVPHDKTTSNDIAIARYMAKIASLKIIHSTSTLKQMEKLNVSTERSTLVPHGSYVGVYPEAITKAAARKQLNIPADEFVILFFGAINAYKGVDDLIAAYKHLPKDKLRLLIVGKCQDEQLHAEILAAADDGTVDFREGYVADEDVAAYFKAADVAALPFKAITTSGSALLALSFGKSIIAPRIGAISDMPENIGILYDPSKKKALQNSLEQAIADRTRNATMSKAALGYAKELSWKTIAAKTYQAFSGMFQK